MTVTSPELPIATFGTLDDAPSLLVDGGYGWVCVAACFIINCFTWGLVSVSQGDGVLNVMDLSGLI